MAHSETIEFYSDNDTYLFWNMDDVPVPVDTDLGSVSSNIERALFLMGFEGSLTIIVDCKKLKYTEEELWNAGHISYLPFSAKAYREGLVHPPVHMSYYMLLMAEDTGPMHANVAVITNSKSEPDSELHRVMHCLKSRGHNVLLVEPPSDDVDLFSVDSLFNNSRLLGGGKPISKKELTSDDRRRVYSWELKEDEDEDDDVSNLSSTKMLDFSEPVRNIKGDRTIIFWDAMGCPFPLSFSPDLIYEKIKSLLLEKGFSDNIIIWAYVDKYLGDKTWDSRIYFLPGGNESSRRIRMVNDMYLLSWDSPLRSHKGTLILVSDHFLCDPHYNELFGNMRHRYYNLILRVPNSRAIRKISDEWLRPLLGIVGKHFYNDSYFFWNMDDFPVPVDTDLGSVSSNIERALFLMGFEGPLTILNCKKLKYTEEELFNAGDILYLPFSAEAYGDVHPPVHMSYYMLLMVEDTGPMHANVALITNIKSEPDSELDRVMHCLKIRGHNVLVVEPPPDDVDLFSVDSLFNNSRLLGGGKPKSKQELTSDDRRRVYSWELTDDEDEDDDDDVSNLSSTKMLDFSEPVRNIKGDRTIIFWDAMDCPFPLSLSPDLIYEKIKSLILERGGFSDNIIIWAYVDKYLGDKTWDSRIYFLSGGYEASRRNRMINDMYLLSRDAPLRSHKGTLILVSDHFLCDPHYKKLFESMKYRSYDLILAVPRAIRKISDSPDEWLRSILLKIGRVPSEHSNTSEIPDE
ncbi:unnamed protein product [Eruca vesicaria subsp. sativa]|uniref:NYN domain-containing protein n=1 Tax=Eruca vesicaria subsp. sativa TaxID=29727 RepID=A0ABC8JKZ9_ERUVS|nr:unnamed protein product [Eruca vesicaria subsp. sativa]